jgi:hypothetical protein
MHGMHGFEGEGFFEKMFQRDTFGAAWLGGALWNRCIDARGGADIGLAEGFSGTKFQISSWGMERRIQVSEDALNHREARRSVVCDAAR